MGRLQSSNSKVKLDFGFSPPTLQVSVGDTVTWTVNALNNHTTTSAAQPPIWADAMMPGQAFSFTFNKSGVNSYVCSIHPSLMQGAITVVSASNAPPLVEISGPTNGSVFVAPVNETISAMVSQPGVAVSRMEFYDGTQLLGTATRSPFSVVLTNAAAGTHVITAQAANDQGTLARSPSVGFLVSAPLALGILDQGATVLLNWSGGAPPYAVQKKNRLSDTNWFDIQTNSAPPATVAKDGLSSFFRLRGNGN